MPKKRFHKIHIEISNICNLQCGFCPPVIRENKMMDLGLFERLVEQIVPLTDLVCLHLMGDPLVHPEFEKMVEICDRYELNIFLVTNGVLMREKHLATLLHPRFYQVNFSLHSFFDNFPEKNPDKYLSRIFEYTDRALAERPELYINYRLWNLQDPRGEDTRNRQMLEKVCEKYHFEMPDGFDVRNRKSVKVRKRLYLHFDTEFVWPSLDLPMLGKQGSCYGLSSHFGILADGTVVPCCLDKEGKISLGNANEETIESILRSNRAQAILDGFRQKKLTESLCQRCQYIERFSHKSLDIKPTIPTLNVS